MTHSIEVQHLSYRYGDVTAIDDLSFRLEGGGIYGLLGRNGSGKTTLLSVLAGFRRASEGDVRIGDEPVFENASAVREICLIREDGDTVDGGESIECAFDFARHMRPYWDDGYAERLLDRFELSPKQKVGELSRGKRAALAVTLGLASRAPVTMFDEAYLGMDAPSRYAFYDELLRDFMERPRTVILSTHLIEEVSSLFQEVLILQEGRLLLHEEADALRGRGVTVLGNADAVDRFVEDLSVLSEKQLGATKSVAAYGEPDAARRRQAAAAGLELGPLPLQDLFVHLTAGSEEDR